jgi:hypothetical protein
MSESQHFTMSNTEKFGLFVGLALALVGIGQNMSGVGSPLFGLVLLITGLGILLACILNLPVIARNVPAMLRVLAFVMISCGGLALSSTTIDGYMLDRISKTIPTMVVHVAAPDISQEHSPNAPPTASRLVAFIQIGPLLPLPDRDSIASGHDVGVRVVFENKGNQPAFDIHNWGSLSTVETSRDAIDESRKAFKKVQQEVHIRTVRAGQRGQSIGIGQQFFNDAITKILTPVEAQYLAEGKLKLMLQIWAGWTDVNGMQGVLDECWLLNLKRDQVKLTNDDQWHTCN